LPLVPTIDPDQPAHVGYSPAVAGLNLNHNRVHFEWKRDGGDYRISMEARTQRHSPAVRMARVALVERDGPLYTHSLRAGREEWTVMRSALGKGGSRWLPVRQPDLYAGDVFRTLAQSAGLTLPEPARAAAMPGGAVLATHQSPPLTEILRGMLRYSTNVTAEAVGLTATLATGAAPRDLADSGRQMAAWAQVALGVNDPRFVDHSGLGDASRITAHDMVRALARPGVRAALWDILRPFPLRGLPEAIRPGDSVKVLAKTGTLNFVSGLAGYVSEPGRDDLVFAIFAADLGRRNALSLAERERPPGGRAWVGRARVLESRLIGRWSTTYRG
jgi:D-alanyl-D-alanine carboxypeptidase/D-alanyl-D-alanine-endopeptidase (penicillin-binding protein 4)